MRKLLLLILIFGIVLSSYANAADVYLDNVQRKSTSIFDFIFGNNYAIYIGSKDVVQNNAIAKGANIPFYYESSATSTCNGIYKVEIYKVGSTYTQITFDPSKYILSDSGSYIASFTNGIKTGQSIYISSSSLSEGNYVLAVYFSCNGRSVDQNVPDSTKNTNRDFGTWTNFKIISNTCTIIGTKCSGFGTIYNIDSCGNFVGPPVKQCTSQKCNSAFTDCDTTLRTCVEQGGSICSANEECYLIKYGIDYIPATDTNKCCLDKSGCDPPTEGTGDTGTGDTGTGTVIGTKTCITTSESECQKYLGNKDACKLAGCEVKIEDTAISRPFPQLPTKINCIKKPDYEIPADAECGQYSIPLINTSIGLIEAQLHEGINPEDASSLTTGDLLASSCTKTEQCKPGSTCKKLRYYIENDFLTEEEAQSKLDEAHLRIGGTAIGALLGGGIVATKAVAICGTASVLTAGTAAPICFGIVALGAVAGAVVGDYIADNINAFSEKSIDKVGICTLKEDTSGVSFGKLFSWAPDFGLSKDKETSKTITGIIIFTLGLIIFFRFLK